MSSNSTSSSYTVHSLKVDQLPHGYPNDPVIVFVGRRKSGKTTGIFGIMHQFRHSYRQIIVICGSLDTSMQYAQHVPDCFIWRDFDEQRLTQVYNENEQCVLEGRTPVPTLIIIDDCMHMGRILGRSEVLHRILYNGRHAGIMLIVSMQECKGLPPFFRSQCSYVFLTREKSRATRERLYDTFNNVFHSFGQFDSILKACTLDYRMMVLDNETQKSDKVCDNVFWYKAVPDLRFKMDRGGPMWRFHSHHYDRQYYKRDPAPAPAAGTGTSKRKQAAAAAGRKRAVRF